MKVAFATLFIVGATITSAIALADPNAKVTKTKGKGLGFCGPAGVACARDVATCGIPGSPCARLKRSADAVAEAFSAAEVGKRGFCGADGLACAKARRSIQEVGEAVEEAVSSIYAREADAVAEARRRKGFGLGFCGPAGVACAKDKRDPKVTKTKGKGLGFCGPTGVACARRVRRSAEAEAKVTKTKGKGLGFCGPAGVACAKSKRDAEADADPEARMRKGRLGFCGPPGVACAKVKRDAEANAHSSEEINIARSIDSLDPEFFKLVRDADNGEGTALRAAHAAFMEVKRDDEALAADATPFELLAYCDEYDCDEETVATIAARAMGTFDERDAEACNAVGGACEIAKRQLEEIEAKLEAAVEAL